MEISKPGSRSLVNLKSKIICISNGLDSPCNSMDSMGYGFT